MPSWKDLRLFCEKDGWELYKKSDRCYYRKLMPDGVLKRTRVLIGEENINPNMWREILKRQLQVSQEYFDENI